MNRNRTGNEKGQTVVIVAAAMIILLIFGAFAVDLSFAYFQRRSMQNAADAAALAGARSLGAYQIDPSAGAMTDNDLFLIIQEYAERNKARDIVAYYTAPGGTRYGQIVPGSTAPAPLTGVTGVEVEAATDFSAFFARVLGYQILPANARAGAAYGAATSARFTSPIAIHEGLAQVGQAGTLWNRNPGSETMDTGWLALTCQYPNHGPTCVPGNADLGKWLTEGYPGFVRTSTHVAGALGDEHWVRVGSLQPGDVLIVPSYDQVYHYTTDPTCGPVYISEFGDEECQGLVPYDNVVTVYTDNPSYDGRFYFNVTSFAAFQVHQVGDTSVSGRWVPFTVEGDWVNAINKGVFVAKLTDVDVVESPGGGGTPPPEGPPGTCDANLALSLTPDDQVGCGPYIFTLMVENTGEQGSAQDVAIGISAITGGEWVQSISPQVWNVGALAAGQVRSQQIVLTTKPDWPYSPPRGASVGSEIRLQAQVINEGCRPDHNTGRQDVCTAIKDEHCEPPTPTPIHSPTPRPTTQVLTTPEPTADSSDPSKWLSDWSGSLEDEQALCGYSPQWVTIKGNVSPKHAGAFAFLQTSWRVVHPDGGSNVCPGDLPDCNQTQYETRLIKGDTSFTIRAWWPGIRSGDEVEVHFGVNLLDQNRDPIKGGGSTSIYWNPSVCPEPTPTPTATPNLVGPHQIDYVSDSFDGTNTTFTYRVTSGGAPSISHWVLNGCFEQADIVSASELWEYVVSDPNLGLQGIKFDRGYNDHESRIVWLTLRGRYSLDDLLFEVGVKSGRDNHFGRVVGPGCYIAPTATPSPTPTPTPTPYNLRVNAGGGAYTDPAGDPWMADHGYSGLTMRSWVNSPIEGTDKDTVLQSHRYGPSYTYQFNNIPNGVYTVNLWFAETYFTQNDQRVFDVAINGHPAIGGQDVHALVGHDHALLRSFSVNVTDYRITLNLSASKNNALISGIEILASE